MYDPLAITTESRMRTIPTTLRTAALLLALVGLGACTAWWGRSFTMVDSSPDFVKYKYWLASVDEGGMNKEARDYCAVYNKVAVLQSRNDPDGHEELVNTYLCVQPVVYAPSVNPIDTK